MNESRKEARVAVSLVTRYREPTMLEPREGQCQDLSWSGMCIHTPKPSPRGALIRFECVTGGAEEWIRGTGRVVWQRGKNDPRGAAGMGVRFVRLEPGSRDALERLVGPPNPRASTSPQPANGQAPAEDRSTIGPGASPGNAPSPGPGPGPTATPGFGAQTLIIAPSSSSSGSTQSGIGSTRSRAVHYPTLRGVGLSSRPPAAGGGKSEGGSGSSSSILPPASAHATHLELPNRAVSPFARSPSSPPEATPAAESESRPFDRTRRGMPSSIAPEGATAKSGDSDRPPRSDRPGEGGRRKSDRPPRPGGVDDLRASAAPSTPRAPDSEPPLGSAVVRSPAEPDYARFRGDHPALPQRGSDPDGQPKRDWMPWIMVGSGIAAALFMVSSFGSLPAFMRSGNVETPAAADIKPVTPPGSAPTPLAPQPPQTQTPPKATPAAARFVLDVSSDPAGARVSVGSRSVIAPGKLDLEAPGERIDVVAELSGYQPSRQQVRAADFATREGGLKVLTVAFKLTPLAGTPNPKAAEPQPPAAPAPAAAAPAAPEPAPRPAPTPRAHSERSRSAASTPQIATPPVPIASPPAPSEPPPAPESPVMSIAPAEPAESAAPKPAGPSPLEQAMECLSRGDNACVIKALEGHTSTERELGLLIETYLATGASANAEREMKRYLERYPAGQHAGKYQRSLDRLKAPAP